MAISAIPGLSPQFLFLIIILMIWEAIWKAIALWKAGRNNQPVWFVFLLLLNTAGILPILFLAFFQKRKVRKIDVKKK